MEITVYRVIEAIITLSDSGKVEHVEMDFDASLEYQGYAADVTYKIQYRFA